MNRREFLKALGGAGLVIPGMLSQTGCAPATITTDSSTGLSLGYVSGDVSADSALVWLRAEAGSRVALQFGEEPSLGQFNSTSTIAVDSSADNCAAIQLDKLRPATRYYYRASVSGKAPGPIASFVTAPAATDDRKIVFCFSGDTRESYQPFTIMQAMQAHWPDFFLHLGDTIYADRGGSARRLEEFWQKYRANRSDPFSENFFSTTSVYAIWDDHEVEDDYLPGDPLAPIGRNAFLDYWPIRRPASEPERIYRSVRWGRAMELFLLDTRQYRDPKRTTMLGGKQHEWLFDALAQSTATFKFIATTVPMAGGGRDRWDGYPKERKELLEYISQKKLAGVFFLSADLHYAAITKIPKSGGLIDITAGPLAAPLNRVTNGTAKRFEYFLAQNFNFAKVTVDPKINANQALIEFIDQNNQVFHTRIIKA
ncbi:MAG TPA: alkaline phosphatase D family protein [Acidobacteriota bacterium]|nr:alkaline phosphatase D family protein [Acidobacteriota bacterium]